MFVDTNKKWTSFYHLSIRHLFFIFYPVILFIIFYFSLLFGATGVDWSKFGDLYNGYVQLYFWYFKYWSYIVLWGGTLSIRLRLFDYIYGSLDLCFHIILLFYARVKVVYLFFYFYIKTILNSIFVWLFSLSYGVGDFFLFLFYFYCALKYIIMGFFKFFYNSSKVMFIDFISLFYLIVIDEIFYNYIVACAFYVLSNFKHAGGSRLLAISNFFKILFNGLSIGAYGVHFQASFERTFFAKVFKAIRRGPYIWTSEEHKLSKERAIHFVRVFFLRLLIIFYFFIPGGDEYRRRSVLWQLLISDLPEDRYIDTSLTPGLRYQVPLYFFIYSNFFAIEVLEFTEIQFTKQQEELVGWLWLRRQYFNSLKSRLSKVIDFMFDYLFYFGKFFMSSLWALFSFIYFVIYSLRSIFVILLNIFQIFWLAVLSTSVFIIRYFLVLQINSILYLYRVSQFLSKVYIFIFDVIFGIVFFVLLFTIIIAPLHYYLLQMLWGMGGVFLAYFYIIWIPLLFLAGLFDEWKLVLHELGEWLFVACFHMGGWSIVCLRAEIDPRFWFLEPDYEQNYYGPMAQEYQGFYLVYAGWFMDAIYIIFY